MMWVTLLVLVFTLAGIFIVWLCPWFIVVIIIAAVVEYIKLKKEGLL